MVAMLEVCRVGEVVLACPELSADGEKSQERSTASDPKTTTSTFCFRKEQSEVVRQNWKHFDKHQVRA